MVQMVLEEENQECQVEQVTLQESRSRGEQWSKIIVKGVGVGISFTFPLFPN